MPRASLRLNLFVLLALTTTGHLVGLSQNLRDVAGLEAPGVSCAPGSNHRGKLGGVRRRDDFAFPFVFQTRIQLPL